MHRFDEARPHVARAALMGGLGEIIERHALAIDQACGASLEAVLAARRRIAAACLRLEGLVPLGTVLADLERLAEADAVYQQAFYWYDDVSPLALGPRSARHAVGRTCAMPNPKLAALCYQRTIVYLAGYVKARVHLAEIYLGPGQIGDAQALLMPTLSRPDPEVRWRYATC